MKNLAEIFATYSEHLRRTNQSKPYIDANIKTALVKYTLPGWGLREGATTQEALEFMVQVPVHQFKDALQVQENVFESLEGKIAGATRRTYRMHLKKLLDWCSKQGLWKQEYENGIPKYAARMRKTDGRKNVNAFRVTNKKKLPDFRLRPDQLRKELIDELERLSRFATAPEVRKRQDPPLKQITFFCHLKTIHQILGWLHNIKSIPLEKINLKLLDDIDLAYDFLDWAREERKIVPATEMAYAKAWLLIAKYHHHKTSKVKQYKDIEIIEELRELLNSTRKRVNTANRVADESKKWLDWGEYLAVVEQLKQECASRNGSKKKRSEAAIASSYQRYLIVAFLGYMPPDRSRTIRELELGRTLIKENEKWYIKLSPEDYKTGGTYGEITTLIPEIIYPQLEEWINKWRKLFSPTHNFLFTQKDGGILSHGGFYGMFRSAVYRISGKALNPHLVRAMAITHFQRSGATDAEMEALALAMKHSREMQRKVYDHRNQQEKVQPALDMMLRQKPSTLSSPKKLEPVKLDTAE